MLVPEVFALLPSWSDVWVNVFIGMFWSSATLAVYDSGEKHGGCGSIKWYMLDASTQSHSLPLTSAVW